MCHLNGAVRSGTYENQPLLEVYRVCLGNILLVFLREYGTLNLLCGCSDEYVSTIANKYCRPYTKEEYQALGRRETG